MPHALILVADGYPERDVHDVAQELQKNGFDVSFCGPERGKTYQGAGGRSVTADLGYLNVNVGKYTLVVVPGGAAAEALAAHKSMYNIVYSMLHKGRTAGLVGAGLKVLLAAGAIKQSPNPIPTGTHVLEAPIVTDRRVTGPEALQEEAEKGGAVWLERPVVQDGPVVTATDLEDDHLRRFIEAVVPLAQRIPV